MSDRAWNEPAQRLLRMIAEKLDDFLDGDELALETLGEAMEEDGYSSDDLQSAILAIRSMAGGGMPTGWIAGAPGQRAARVLSSEERDSLSTEAWGYLLDQRRQGTLDSEQFERVLDLLTGSGMRPVSIELAREVASRVAIEIDDSGNAGEVPHGDSELAH